MRTQMRLTGLATGLDTDAMIQNLGRVHTLRIDAVKRDRQFALWRQETLRSTINMITNFQRANLNNANMASNFRSAAAFAKFSYNVFTGVATEANKARAAGIVNVTANGDLKNFNQSIQAVTQLASRDSWNGSEVGLRGIKSSGFDVETFVNRNAQGNITSASLAMFGLSVDGVSRTINIAPDVMGAIARNNSKTEAVSMSVTDGGATTHYRTITGDIGLPAGVNKLKGLSVEFNGKMDTVENHFNKMVADGLPVTIDFDGFAGMIEINGGKMSFNVDSAALDYLTAQGLDELVNFINSTNDGSGGQLYTSADFVSLDDLVYDSSAGSFVTLRDFLVSNYDITSEELDIFHANHADESGLIDVGASGLAARLGVDEQTIGSGMVKHRANPAYDDKNVVQAFADAVNSEITRLFGADYAGMAGVRQVDGRWELEFHKIGSNITIFDAIGTGDMLQSLGFPPGGASTGSVNNRTLGELFGPDFFRVPDAVNADGSPRLADRTIRINGQAIVVSASDTISTLTSKINNSSAGVTFAYNSAGDKFSLTSSVEGSAANIQDVTDTTAQFFGLLGLGTAVEVERTTMGSEGGVPVERTVVGHRLMINGELQLLDGEKISAAEQDRLGLEPVAGEPGRFTASGAEFVVGKRDMGTNLIAVINNEVFVRQSNSFHFEGMTYSFNSTFNEGAVTHNTTTNRFEFDITNIPLENRQDEIRIEVGKNITEIIDGIKSFVDEYNNIVDTINGLLSERRDRDFRPLSEDERRAMSEEDIKTYEAKAKLGMLSNDSDLRKLLDQMRTSLYQNVTGVGLTMSEIGITTSANWKDGGKLVINEIKLTEALENRYDQVVALFTKTSSIPATDTANRGRRQAETGIAQRLNDILNDAVRTTRDANNNKGFLIEKSGIENDSSVVQNAIQRQIDQYDKRISTLLERWYRQENAYYMMFSRMETAMGRMQAQQNSLGQILSQQGR
jgi:flagellar capping protein FliD